MAVKVIVGAPFRRFTGNRPEIEIEGCTVGEVIGNLQAIAPGFRDRLLDNDGEVCHFVAVFLNGEDIRKLGGAGAPVKEGDEIVLAPAAAGG